MVDYVGAKTTFSVGLKRNRRWEMDSGLTWQGLGVCCVGVLWFAKVWKEDDMVAVEQAWCWDGDLYPILIA